MSKVIQIVKKNSSVQLFLVYQCKNADGCIFLFLYSLSGSRLIHESCTHLTHEGLFRKQLTEHKWKHIEATHEESNLTSTTD